MGAIATARAVTRSDSDHASRLSIFDVSDPLRDKASIFLSEIEALLDQTEAEMLRALGLTQTLDTNSITPAASIAGDHLRCGGQRIRARLTLSACLGLSVSTEDAVRLAAAAELLHNASLVHDDLQDRDATRRGAPAIWRAYGDGVAVCAGDLLLSAAYGVLAGFSRPALLGQLLVAMHQATAEAIEGQCADLSATRTIDIDRYRDIVIAKSGAMLGLPLSLALIAGGEPAYRQQAREACNAFAVAYQVADDLADLALDAQEAPGKHALNAVLVLQAAGLGDASIDRARRLGRESLNRVATTTNGLPGDCAWFLRDLALGLARTL